MGRPRIIYGRWRVIGNVGKRYMTCRCACGTVKDVRDKSLYSGQSKSCGCLRHELFTVDKIAARPKHGMYNSTEYVIWNSMKNRCLQKSHKNYNHYGGRGISICKRWQDSFICFYKDMGRRPSMKHSLDRTNNNGDYEPSNCKWILSYRQHRNKRSNVFKTYKGNRYCLTEWSEKLDVTLFKIIYWTKKRNMSFKEFVETKTNYTIQAPETYEECNNETV